MGTIFWNGRSSSEIPIVVERQPDYVIAERDYDVEHVPGRNGDLLIDNESYKNVPRPYDIAFGSYTKTHSEMALAVSEWLHSASGYARLEDTYESEYFRMAYYQEEVELENILNHLGRATITFICMPQRFLKSGEKSIIFKEKSQKIHNPTRFKAKPLINISGTDSGTITVNGVKILIQTISGLITLDSDLQEAYSGSISKNSFISWPDSDEHLFPSLNPGLNDISITGGITKVEVIPRWWTL